LEKTICIPWDAQFKGSLTLFFNKVVPFKHRNKKSLLKKSIFKRQNYTTNPQHTFQTHWNPRPRIQKIQKPLTRAKKCCVPRWKVAFSTLTCRIFFVFLGEGFSGFEKYVVGLWYNFAFSKSIYSSKKRFLTRKWTGFCRKPIQLVRFSVSAWHSRIIALNEAYLSHWLFCGDGWRFFNLWHSFFRR